MKGKQITDFGKGFWQHACLWDPTLLVDATVSMVSAQELTLRQVQYSDPPNTEPRSVFRFDFMPVLGI
jgi:hypothetical protein